MFTWHYTYITSTVELFSSRLAVLGIMNFMCVHIKRFWMQYNISAIYVPQKHWLRLAHPLLPTQLEHYCSTFEYMCLNRQVMKTCWAEEKRFGNAYRHVFVTAACLSVPDLQSTSALEMSHRNACHYIMHYLQYIRKAISSCNHSVAIHTQHCKL